MSDPLNHLESFRTFRRSLFPKPVSWFGLFLPFLTTSWLYQKLIEISIELTSDLFCIDRNPVEKNADIESGIVF